MNWILVSCKTRRRSGGTSLAGQVPCEDLVMQNQRKHKRFHLRLIAIDCKVNLIGRVDIVDISLGGVLLKTKGKLDLGKECSVTFGYHGRCYPAKGIVVRSELSGFEEQSPEQRVPRYSVAIEFKPESTGMIGDFLQSVEQDKKFEVPTSADWRYRDVRFHLTTPSEQVLEFPAQFTIKEINRGGMIIQVDQCLNVDAMVLVELSFDASYPMGFMGRVVSCRSMKNNDHGGYNIGVEFVDLTERTESLLTQLIDGVKTQGN
jgi:hypothetical protein